MENKIEISEKHMGGTFTIKCFSQSLYNRYQTNDYIYKAFAEVKRIENLLTEFKNSPFNNINNYAGIAPVKVPSEIIDIIEQSFEVSKYSNGMFDISYASIGNIWKKARSSKKSPKKKEIDKAKKHVNYKKIVVNKENQTVFLPNINMRISLGGIGKGYAVDRAYTLLQDSGLENFHINGSGDIRVHTNSYAPRPWNIGIRNPFSINSEAQIGVIQLTSGAIATSGDYINCTNIAEKKIHHIINPRSGNPTDEIVSCTVIADDAITADTMATTGMLLGKAKSLKHFNSQKTTAFIISKDGTTYLTKKALLAFERYTQERN